MRVNIILQQNFPVEAMPKDPVLGAKFQGMGSVYYMNRFYLSLPRIFSTVYLVCLYLSLISNLDGKLVQLTADITLTTRYSRNNECIFVNKPKAPWEQISSWPQWITFFIVMSVLISGEEYCGVALLYASKALVFTWNTQVSSTQTFLLYSRYIFHF